MKHLYSTLSIAATILAGQSALAANGNGTFTFNVVSGFNFIGIQTPNVLGGTSQSLSTYFQGSSDFDSVTLWDDVNNVCGHTFYYLGGGWVNDDGSFSTPANPSLPVGSGVIYNSGVAHTVTLTDCSPALPTATPAWDGYFKLLTSQKPIVGLATTSDYCDWVGTPGACTPVTRTYVYTWNSTGQGYDSYYRYSGNWKHPPPTPSLIPTIPIHEAAMVGRFNTLGGLFPAPISLLQVGSDCAPFVTLRLTFNSSILADSPDPTSVAAMANYTICRSGTLTVAGTVVNATPEYSPSTTVDGCPLIPRIESVLLRIKLQTQPGNLYDLKAPGVITLRGAHATFALPFTLCSGGSPANDTPSSALLPAFQLTAGTTFYGSLVCASPTPAGTLSWTPAGAGPNAKDVWYSFTTTESGTVAITTCQPLLSICPQSDTQLAVYTGNPGDALQVGVALQKTGLTVNNQDWGSGSCPINPNAARIKFSAVPCTTYFVRVSGKTTGALPGGFALQLNFSVTGPNNTACGTALSVSANSSTPFTVPAGSSVWFKFKAPPAPGPWITEVDTCQANFNSAVAVFGPFSGVCPGSAVAPTLAMNCPATPFTFPADATKTYYIRVDNPGASTGCGFLHVASGIPSSGTASAAGANCRIYTIQGVPNNVPWTWSISAPPSASCPSGFNLAGSAGPVATGSLLGATAIANEFRDQINAAFTSAGGIGTIASVTAAPGFATTAAARLKICTVCPVNGLVLKVGPSSGTPDCWVQFDALPVAFPPCNFNPNIYEIGDPDGLETDCNGNGQPDYVDILLGTSADVDGDGVPDECLACLPSVVLDGPNSVSAFLGGTATFQAQTAGSGTLTYQWRKDGVPLSGQTASSLQLANVSEAAAGGYDVVVSNACGQATSPEALLVVGLEPVLNIARTGPNVVLTWSAPDYQLQGATSLGSQAIWSSIPGGTNAALPVDNAHRFFRLISP
jgi:hypothetical protein